MFEDTIIKVIKRELCKYKYEGSLVFPRVETGIIKEAIDNAIILDKATNHYIKCEKCKCLLELKDALVVKVLKEGECDKFYCKRCKPNYDVINKDGRTHKNKL